MDHHYHDMLLSRYCYKREDQRVPPPQYFSYNNNHCLWFEGGRPALPKKMHPHCRRDCWTHFFRPRYRKWDAYKNMWFLLNLSMNQTPVGVGSLVILFRKRQGSLGPYPSLVGIPYLGSFFKVSKIGSLKKTFKKGFLSIFKGRFKGKMVGEYRSFLKVFKTGSL